jgi:hypothetical protein
MTKRKISRQLAWRRDRLKRGLCVQCGKKRQKKSSSKRLCIACLGKDRDRKRAAKILLDGTIEPIRCAIP